MSFYKITLNLSLSAIAFIAMPLLASAKPKPTNPAMEKKSIEVNQSATVDGKTLTPGTYEILIDGNKISFEHDGKTVVTAPCDWKSLTYKSPYDSTTYSKNGAIQEIEFAGRHQALEIM